MGLEHDCCWTYRSSIARVRSSNYAPLLPMSDYNDETTFLRRILFYDASSASKRVDQSIARVHRDRACVRKAAEFAAVTVLMAVVLSQAEFFQSNTNVRLWPLCVVGLAAVICLVTFLCLLIVYRVKLDGLRAECRTLVRKLVENRLTPTEQILPTPAGAGTPSSNGYTSRSQTASSGSSAFENPQLR